MFAANAVPPAFCRDSILRKYPPPPLGVEGAGRKGERGVEEEEEEVLSA